MAFGVKKGRPRNPKGTWQIKIGNDVIKARTKKELDEKMKKGVILWHYKPEGLLF